MKVFSHLSEELQNARSFPSTKGPDTSGMMLVKAVRTENDTFYFYKDEEGNYYYDTDGQRRVEKELGKKKRNYRR